MALCFEDACADIAGYVPLHRCVGHLYFGFGTQGWNPFTVAVNAYLRHGHWQILERYYDVFQPKTLAEAYFMRNHSRWKILATCSPFLRLKPWRSSEILMSGHDGSGNQNFGPVTTAKLRQERLKYARIISSIKRNGYKPEHYGPIRGYFLMNDASSYVFRITQGMHRLSVLDALGWTSIPVAFDPRMPRYISCRSLRYWPKVIDGAFAPELAAYVFQRHFWDRGRIKQRMLEDRL